MTDWNPDDPDTVNVHYDLAAWTPDQEAELIEALAENEIPHIWDGRELIVPEDVELELDAIFEVLEAELGIEAGAHLDATDTDDADTGSGGGLADGRPVTEYDLEDWELAERATLTEALVVARITHRWEDAVLVVPTESESVVEDLMTDIESGEWSVDDDIDDVDLLGMLRSAARGLERNPYDDEAQAELSSAFRGMDQREPGLGVPDVTWSEIYAVTSELVGHLQQNEDLDEGLVTGGAARLRELLAAVV